MRNMNVFKTLSFLVGIIFVLLIYLFVSPNVPKESINVPTQRPIEMGSRHRVAADELQDVIALGESGDKQAVLKLINHYLIAEPDSVMVTKWTTFGAVEFKDPHWELQLATQAMIRNEPSTASLWFGRFEDNPSSGTVKDEIGVIPAVRQWLEKHKEY